MIMENLRSYGCALTNGSNHLTNNLSVTALKRLLPVFLMMIFMGIGTDVLGQTKNIYTGTAVFTLEQLHSFSGKNNSSYTSGDKLITLSSSSVNVQPTINDIKGPRGAKVRPTGAFKITASNGAQITSITLITDRYDRKLDSSVSCTETTDDTKTNRTYTYSNATGDITFTNNNNNVNIYVSSITVNYTYTDADTQTQLVGTFANNIIGYEGDKGTPIPALKVTAGSTKLNPSEYTVEYSSSNPAIEISNGKINLKAPSEAVITATITPKNTTLYAACSATFIVSAKALMDLSVDVNDVYMFTNDEDPTMPVVNVDALTSNGTKRLIADTDYTYKYSLKTDGGNLTISKDGKTITVAGAPRNYTAGNNVITVTVTPTPSCIAQHHCKKTSFDFTFNVTKAGDKTKPIIDFADSVALNATQKVRQLNARISYNGEDITDYFTITYATTDASIITINGNELSTTGATGTATMTITATPKPDFAQQYDVATKDVNITVKALKALIVTPATIANQNLTTGGTFQIPELIVKVEENGTLLDRDDDYVVTYLSSSPNVATIDKEGIVTAFDEGQSIITIHISDVKTNTDEKNYEYTEISFKVNVDDPAVFKVPDAQTDYNIGKVLSTENGNLCVTLGGWIFNKKEFKAEDYGTTKEIFGDDKNQYWGKTPATTGTSSFSPESFKYLIDAGKMKNPRNEFASNCQPQSINVYDKTLKQQPSTLIDPMFNVPTSGSYLIFEPKTNGTVTATVMQNGVFDVTSNKPGYRPQRRVFVLDEAGMLIQSTPKLEVTSGKFDANNKDFTKYPWDLQDTPNASQELVKAHFGIVNFQSDDDKFQNEVRECLINNDIIHNNAAGENFKGAKGWSVMVAAPVTYTFNVKAGKTYYLYNFGSRIGLFGFSMKESNPTEDVVKYKETENNTVTPTAEGHVAKVSLDRKFAVNKWNAAVLPFSLNKQQVDAIFGQTYDKNHTDGTQILYFEKTEGKYVYYTRHAYNTIVAGKPFLIKPTGKTADKTNVATLVDGSIVLNTEKITAFPYVTIENVSPEDWGRDAETADYHWHSAYKVENVKPNDYYFNSEGVLVMREMSDAKIQAFRGFLQKKATAQAKLFSVAYFDLLSDNSDIPSKIEGVMMDSNGELVDIKAGDAVYNLSGQVVTTDASSLYSLPKGIYIVNGKKYVVE